MTSSGNLSYHATGEALDFSNGYETPQEMAFARYMVSRFGSRLAELIYTPLGFSIKDGQKVPPIALRGSITTMCMSRLTLGGRDWGSVTAAGNARATGSASAGSSGCGFVPAGLGGSLR
jgi:hypothetical protein